MRHSFGDPEADVCARCKFTRQTITQFAMRCGEKWERRGLLVTVFETAITKEHGSINAAKRMSRKLQQSGRGLGRGEMRVIR